MAEQTLLLYTKETADAIKKAAKVPPQSEGDSYYKPIPKQQLLINSNRQETAHNAKYNSYFKLVLIYLEDNNCKVNVIDGAYEGDEYVLDRESFCYVNRIGFQVKGWESPIYSPEQGDVYFALKASIINGDLRVDIVGVENAKTLPDGDNNTAWYQLGRLLRNPDGSARIIQDHNSGVPQILWFYRCEDE